ncbi:MAG: hypothetical protein FD152_2167 [Xanthobacteraceae bacterium]|nr:MAG: hypothetical protein FD152_2167 [Xanthobacteraceae bacterium]
MRHSRHSFRVGTGRAGFGRGYPRVPTIISVGVVTALILALVVAGLSLTGELIDPATIEEGADAETLVLSGTVLVAITGLVGLLIAMLRRLFTGTDARKDPSVAA